MNYITKDTHIDYITSGSTILHNGELKTVTQNDIHFSSFMGTSLFGDSYHCGHKKVKQVFFTHKNEKGQTILNKF